jgi:excisionase family DNA binding protein
MTVPDGCRYYYGTTAVLRPGDEIEPATGQAVTADAAEALAHVWRVTETGGRTFMFQLVATGEIDSFKVGKHRKIPNGALDTYIERLREEQAAAPRSARTSGQAI